MAVESRHMNLLPSQFIPSRDLMKSDLDICYTQMTNGLSYAPETLLPYHQLSGCDWGSGKSSMNNNNNNNNKSDSGLTSNFTAPRKRTRHSVFDELNNFTLPQQKITKLSGFIDQEIVSQIQQHQSEIDCFIALHTEKMRIELEERKKRQSRMLVSAIEERVVKKLKEKDEEIEKMGKLNWVLQEKVKTLYMENQLWRDLAQTNEATVNSLRNNLEQVLAHVSDDGHTAAEDAESSCGSSDHGREVEDKRAAVSGGGGGGGGGCRKCGEGESRVLLLPCRHLCLCTMCGSTLHTCPVCNSAINASVHVNFS